MKRTLFIEHEGEKITITANADFINAILKGIKTATEEAEDVSVVVCKKPRRINNWRFITRSFSFINTEDENFIGQAKVYGELDGLPINTSSIMNVMDEGTHLIIRTYSGSLYALYPNDIFGPYVEAYPYAYDRLPAHETA